MARLLVALALAALGCRNPSPRSCPDSPQMKCLTAPQCTWDKEHDCERCVCGDPGYVPPQKTPPK